MNKKSKIYIVVLIWTAAILQLFVNKSINREEKMVEQAVSFGVTNLTESVAKAYALYGKDELTPSGKEMIVKKLGKSLGITTGYEIHHKTDGENETTTFLKEGEKADTTIQVISLVGEDENGYKTTENYILTEIKLKGMAGSEVYNFKEQLVHIYTKLGMEPNTNIYLCSQVKGVLSEEERIQQIQLFLEEMDAKEVTEERFNNVVCVYGYSKNIVDYVYQNQNKVNVNIAFSYDEEEDITYIHRGIPFVDRSF